MKRIVINPDVMRRGDRRDALCVCWNERLRIWMEETGFEPQSEPTAKQREFFSDTAYADDEIMLRRTILARIATLDTSVEDPTDEQVGETLKVLQGFKSTEKPSNENEAVQLDRLIALVEAVTSRPGEAR